MAVSVNHNAGTWSDVTIHIDDLLSPANDVIVQRGPLAFLLRNRRDSPDRIYQTNQPPGAEAIHNVKSNVSLLPSTLENSTATVLEATDSSALHWGVLALSVLIVATAIGNILVCLAVCWDRRLQNMTNYFLMSLAIADLLVALLVMPLGLVVELYGAFPLAPSLCVIWATMDVLMCTASIWHMCTMSMDRYFTLKYPMKYGRNKTKMMVAMKITFVWVVSIAICSPIFIMGFVDMSHVYDDTIALCTPNIPNFVIYGSVFAFYVPLCIMVVTYLLTTRILRTNQKLMKNLIQEQQAHKVTTNGRLLNNSYMQNVGKLTTMSLPVSTHNGGSRETSISERASIHESDNYLEKRSPSTSSQKRTYTKHTSQDETTSPASNSQEDRKIPIVSVQEGRSSPEESEYQFEPLSPDNVNFAFGESQTQGVLTGMPSLSVSQPHLPSLDNDTSYNEHKHLAPSKSHNILSTRQLQMSQLSVNDLESVKNFDSLLSLNSMLSKNWGSEAWSDFDDPAMFEKLSQIEAEMDECLVKPSKNGRDITKTNTEPGIQSTSDADSFIYSPSFVVGDSPGSNTVFTPKSSTKGVFLYPGSNPESPGYDQVNELIQRGYHKDKTCSHRRDSGTAASPTGMSGAHHSNGQDSRCANASSPTGKISSNLGVDCKSDADGIFTQKSNSPAIMIEDTSFDPPLGVDRHCIDDYDDNVHGKVTGNGSSTRMNNSIVPPDSIKVSLSSNNMYLSNDVDTNVQKHIHHCNPVIQCGVNITPNQQSEPYRESQHRHTICITNPSDTTPGIQCVPDEEKTTSQNGQSVPMRKNLSSPNQLDKLHPSHQGGHYRDNNTINSVKQQSRPSSPTRLGGQNTSYHGNNLSSPDHQSAQSSASQQVSPCSPSRQLLQLDLDTLVITPVTTPTVTVAPVITTSPASSRSQTSPVNIVESPVSSKSAYITIQLKPKGCYMYKLGNSLSTEFPSDTEQHQNKVETSDITVVSSQNDREDVIDYHHLQANGYVKSETTSLSPNGSYRHLMSCPSPSLVETELLSQEVERSTDDTLSDPQSFSTTSTSRHHIPSLSVHWSGKAFTHGIQLKTFLRQVSFRRSKYKHGEFANKQVMSKRTANNEKKASKVLGIIFAVFVILWSPFFVVNTVIAKCIPCQAVITQPVMASLVWLGYLSSLANPIIYTMFNTSFRRAFTNILTCKLRRRNARHGGRGSNKLTKLSRGNTLYYSTYTSERKSNHHLRRS